MAEALAGFPEGRETVKQWNEFVFRGYTTHDTLMAFTQDAEDDLATLLAEINAATALPTPPPSDDNREDN